MPETVKQTGPVDQFDPIRHHVRELLCDARRKIRRGCEVLGSAQSSSGQVSKRVQAPSIIGASSQAGAVRFHLAVGQRREIDHRVCGIRTGALSNLVGPYGETQLGALADGYRPRARRRKLETFSVVDERSLGRRDRTACD
jgi:hypothetical protein